MQLPQLLQLLLLPVNYCLLDISVDLLYLYFAVAVIVNAMHFSILLLSPPVGCCFWKGILCFATGNMVVACYSSHLCCILVMFVAIAAVDC